MVCYWDDPPSIGEAVRTIARKIVGLRGIEVLLLGRGEPAESAIRALGGDAGHVRVADVLHARAVETARRLGGAAIPLSAFKEQVRDTDVLVSSLGSADPLLSRTDMEGVVSGRRRPFTVLFDLCEPHTIDPLVHRMEGVFLYDMRDLYLALEPHMCKRRRQSMRALQHS